MAQIEDELFERVRRIRKTKGREYATDEDTLADFKEVAEETGTTPLQTWAVYVKKHERAIDAYIREGSVKSEAIQDRILDVIVYHLLLLGLIEDLRAGADVDFQDARVWLTQQVPVLGSELTIRTGQVDLVGRVAEATPNRVVLRVKDPDRYVVRASGWRWLYDDHTSGVILATSVVGEPAMPDLGADA